jgi:hypothetical protein
MAKQRSIPWAFLIVCGLSIAAAASSFAATRALGDPAPLDAVLPDVPALFEIIPRENIKETSVVERRIPEVLLEHLAPQPDGSPPLKYGISVDLGDFHIRHPYGTSSSSPGPEQALELGVLLQGEVLYDQPLQKIMYTIPFRLEEESVSTYASRTRYELEQDGAVFHSDVRPLAVEGYRFEHYEYDLEIEGGAVVSHYTFIGPFGKHRVLAMDFMMTPELHELARPYVWKIMRSFSAGWNLRQGAQDYDADYIARNELDDA